MKTLRTAGILLAVALSATGLALLPSLEETPGKQPGIVVGEEDRASDAGGGTSALPGDVPEPSGAASGPVDLPRSDVTEQPADDGAGAVEYETSKAPEPTATTGSSSGGGSSAAKKPAAPEKPAAPQKPAAPEAPSSTCEWDDGDWDCDDDDDGDDDSDDDD